MGKALVALLGSGITIGVVRATAQHYWTKHLNRRDT